MVAVMPAVLILAGHSLKGVERLDRYQAAVVFTMVLAIVFAVPRPVFVGAGFGVVNAGGLVLDVFAFALLFLEAKKAAALLAAVNRAAVALLDAAGGSERDDW
jgi:hypothetical protein